MKNFLMEYRKKQLENPKKGIMLEILMKRSHYL